MNEATPPSGTSPAAQVQEMSVGAGRGVAQTALRLLKKSLGYTWASPNSVLGLMIVTFSMLSRGNVRYIRGAIEVHGGFAEWFLRNFCGGAMAMTLGHVILGLDQHALDISRDHEHVHIEQYMRWGPLFLPIYGTSSFLCWKRGKNPYLENIFEIEAYGRCPIG